VAEIKELQLLLDFGATWQFGFYEKKPHAVSDLVNPVDSLKHQRSRCTELEAIRYVARLVLICQPVVKNEC
jgi:hypothetical protein